MICKDCQAKHSQRKWKVCPFCSKDNKEQTESTELRSEPEGFESLLNELKVHKIKVHSIKDEEISLNCEVVMIDIKFLDLLKQLHEQEKLELNSQIDFLLVMLREKDKEIERLKGGGLI